MVPKSPAEILQALGSAKLADRQGVADPALRVLVERLEAMESAERMRAQELAAARQEMGEMRSLLQQLAAEKAQTEVALQAALGARQKAQESLPADERTRELIVAQLQKDVGERIRDKVLQFRAALRDLPRGTVYNQTDHVVLLTVKGVTAAVVPGKNELPQPFVEAWDDCQEAERFASERERAMRGGNLSFGQLEDWLWKGKFETDPVLLPVSGPGTQSREMPQEFET